MTTSGTWLDNDIEHTKTKAHHPQTNGIGERFHKTTLQEFYQVAGLAPLSTACTTFAILFASRDGTAFPTWWYCCVRFP